MATVASSVVLSPTLRGPGAGQLDVTTTPLPELQPDSVAFELYALQLDVSWPARLHAARGVKPSSGDEHHATFKPFIRGEPVQGIIYLRVTATNHGRFQVNDIFKTWGPWTTHQVLDNAQLLEGCVLEERDLWNTRVAKAIASLDAFPALHDDLLCDDYETATTSTRITVRISDGQPFNLVVNDDSPGAEGVAADDGDSHDSPSSDNGSYSYYSDSGNGSDNGSDSRLSGLAAAAPQRESHVGRGRRSGRAHRSGRPGGHNKGRSRRSRCRKTNPPTSPPPGSSSSSTTDNAVHTRDASDDTPVDTTLPGAPTDPNIDLSSGQVTLTKTLGVVNAGSLEYSLDIVYSSTRAKQATVWNYDAPTGVVQQSWALDHSQVFIYHQSGVAQAEYALVLRGTLVWLKPIGFSNGDKLYGCKPHKFWLVTYNTTEEEWKVVVQDGSIYRFGGQHVNPDAIEYNIQRGNFYGNAPSGNQTRHPMVWNLSRIEQPSNENYISFAYQSTTEQLGSAGDFRDPTGYTQSCRLSTITSSTGGQLVLNYDTKNSSDYVKPHQPVVQSPPPSIYVQVDTYVTDAVFDPDPKIYMYIKDAATNGSNYNYSPSKEKHGLHVSNTFELPEINGVAPPDLLNIHIKVKDKRVFGDELMFEETWENVQACDGSRWDTQNHDDYETAVTTSFVKVNLVANGPDAYQDRYIDQELSQVSVVDRNGDTVERVCLTYEQLKGSTGEFTKRSLVQVRRLLPNSDDLLRPPTVYEYYSGTDGVTYLQPQSGDALYGALKTRTTEEGGKITYTYGEVTAPHTQLSQYFTRPSSDIAQEWQKPRVYHGTDYIAVLWWRKTGSVAGPYKDYKQWVYLKIYDFVDGAWKEVGSVGPLFLGHDWFGDDFQYYVHCGNGFVALYTNAEDQPLTLVSRRFTNHSAWTVTPISSSLVPVNCKVDVGDDFVAVLNPKASSQQLRIFYRTTDGTTWMSNAFNLLSTTTDSVMVAQGGIIFVLGAYQTARLQIFYRDDNYAWQVRSDQSGPILFDYLTADKARTMKLQFGGNFVGVETYERYGGDKHDKYQKWKFWAVSWGPTAQANIEWTHLKTITQSTSGSLFLDRDAEMTVLEHSIHVDYLGYGDDKYKDVFRLLGSSYGPGWHHARFRIDATQHQYQGDDALTTTIDGKAKLRVFDLDTIAWNRSTVPEYSDGNPTKYEKYWDTFLTVSSIALMFSPKGWVLRATVVEAAFFAADLLYSYVTTGMEGGQQGSRYFTAANKVYHREASGQYSLVGTLSSNLEKQVTQNSANYIAYQVENSGTAVRFLKNGGFAGDPVQLDSTNRLSSDGVGPYGLVTRIVKNSHYSYDSPSGITLWKIAGDKCEGNVTGTVVTSAKFEDGQRTLYTHYEYDDTTAIPQAGDGLRFAVVTTVYSGTSPTPDKTVSGSKQSFFYTRSTGMSQQVNEVYHNFFAFQGAPYYEQILDGSDAPVFTSSTNYNLVTYSESRADLRSYDLQPVWIEDVTTNGEKRTTRHTYNEDNGLVETTTTSNYNVLGNGAHQIVTYTYGFEHYNALRTANNLVDVYQTVVTVGNEVRASTVNTYDTFNDSSIFAKRKTFKALTRGTGAFPSHQHPDPSKWYLAEEIISRHPVSGVPTEVTNGGLNTHTSYILDVTGSRTLATFVNASIDQDYVDDPDTAQNTQCGYYSFTSFDDVTPWRVQSIGIEPKAFAPTSATVVSAYFLVNSSGPFPSIGFANGGPMKQVGPSDLPQSWTPAQPQWVYAEVTGVNLTADQKPFASWMNPISVRDFRFAPVDSQFSATHYAENGFQATSRLGTNGERNDVLYDKLYQASATLYNSTSPQEIAWSVDGTLTSPGQVMTLKARTAGRYLPQTESGVNNPHFNTSLGSTDGSAFGDPVDGNVAVQITMPSAAQLSDLNFQVTVGGGSVRVNDSTLTVTQGNHPYTIPAMFSRFVMWASPSHVWVWLDNVQVMKNALSTSWNGNVLITDYTANPAGNMRLRDVCILGNPIGTAVYSDGMGRDIQQQTLGDDCVSMVAQQQFYDGWGEVEITTKPGPIGGTMSWTYHQNLATFNDANGELGGIIASYQPYGDQGKYAYYRLYLEHHALKRVTASALPGDGWVMNKRRMTRFSYDNTDANVTNLMQRLNLSTKYVTNYNTLVVYKTIGDDDQPTVVLKDLDGKVIATAVDQTVINTIKYGYTASGEKPDIVSPPAYYDDSIDESVRAQFQQTYTYDFEGNLRKGIDPDSKTTRYMFDNAGQLRFKQWMGASADTGAESSTAPIMVYKYDALGRVIEVGSLANTKWSDAQLQADAEDPTYPTAAGNDDYTIRTTQLFDITSDNSSTNLKTKLWRTIDYDSTGAKSVEETFAYDRAGRVVEKDRFVPAFDTDESKATRVTLYEYDQTGGLTKSTYPHAPGTPDDELQSVVNTFNVNGRLARVGNTTASDAYVTSYKYHIDGSFKEGKTAKIGGKPLLNSMEMNLQGVPSNIQYSRAGTVLFEEGLQYVSDSGEYWSGSLMKTNITGASARGSYAISFGYDTQRRLKTATADSAVNADLGCSVQYNINGNVTDIQDQSTALKYSATFCTGSNRVQSVQIDGGAPTSYVYTMSGNVYTNAQLTNITYDDSTEMATAYTTVSDDASVQIVYNSHGQRVMKTVNGVKRLYSHGMKPLPLQETLSDGTSTNYIYGATGLLVADNSTEASWVVKDHSGSVRGVCSGVTNPGTMTYMDYDPYGGLAPPTSAGIDVDTNRYLYTGQEYDNDSSLHNYRLRLYDSNGGSFLATDPARQGYTPYLYCNGDPVNLVDPTGAVFERQKIAVKKGYLWLTGRLTDGQRIRYQAEYPDADLDLHARTCTTTVTRVNVRATNGRANGRRVDGEGPNDRDFTRMVSPDDVQITPDNYQTVPKGATIGFITQQNGAVQRGNGNVGHAMISLGHGRMVGSNNGAFIFRGTPNWEIHHLRDIFADGAAHYTRYADNSIRLDGGYTYYLYYRAIPNRAEPYVYQ